MLTPDYKSFLQLSRDSTLVPVAKTLSADLLTPVGAFLSIAARQKYAFLLESVEGGEKIGRYTFLGAQPRTVITARGQELTIREGSSVRAAAGQRDRVAARALAAIHVRRSLPELPPFTSGGVGYFAYDMVRQFERLPERAKDDLGLARLRLHFLRPAAGLRSSAAPGAHHCRRRCARRSRRARPTIARSPTSPPSSTNWRAASRPALALVRRRRRSKPIKVHDSTSHDQFVESVRTAKEYIAAGDIFQVVLSQRLDFKPPAEPFQIYRALRTVNPSPYMFFLKLDDMHVVGASPEMLVRVSGRKLEYRPIAGTRKRGADPAEDERLTEELRNDEKERAEHVMLVDLGRNDLGRVSEYGTVKVRDLMYVEKYSHVMHLVSALEGHLRDDLDALDALAACFPAGTLSGAPKVRAMEIIEELEPVRRGVYGGSVLYADYAGNLDSCIAIRTMVVHRRSRVCAGGRGHRRRLRSRERVSGVHEQGERVVAGMRAGWKIVECRTVSSTTLTHRAASTNRARRSSMSERLASVTIT